MKNNLLDLYQELGLDTGQNTILGQLLELTQIKDGDFKKQFELFHMDLILGLSRIKKVDEKNFQRYIKKLNETKNKSNFGGERFEVFMHSKLILVAEDNIISTLSRGKDGEEADLVFNFKSSKLGIELGIKHFISPPKDEDHMISKIIEVILEKNNKPYSNDKCALLVDITNIVFYAKQYGINLKELFSKKFEGFSFLENKKVKFGMVIMCNSIYKERKDHSLYHSLNPYFGLIDDNMNVDQDLYSFMKILFNNFKPDPDYIKSTYHFNI